MKPLLLSIILAGSLVNAAPAPGLKWQGWSDSVFDQAKREHKFVLLDLEAVWCHWCHVMADTTYKDPQVIALLQSKYIVVRVDQDSRPDLASRYEDYGSAGHHHLRSQGRRDCKAPGLHRTRTDAIAAQGSH